MAEQETRESLLEPYRVLDLAEGGCLIAGKILGDLGADVIKIEPPGGSPSRNVGPFYRDTDHPEKSLFWFAYNTNKRGITLDIETADGKELFKRLVKSADFVLESFEPGYMASLGLGYEELERINPGIIMTSITPFGASGPYARYKASDLTTWAMGGFMAITGEPGRPPVWIGFPQASLHGGAMAAAASLIAHWHREMTGEGQHIDVSIQQCVTWCLATAPRYYEFLLRFLNLSNLPRMGAHQPLPHALSPGLNYVFPCKDGAVYLILLGGSNPSYLNSTKQLVSYMDENGMAPDWLKEFDWVNEYDASKLTQDVIDRVQGVVTEFLMTKTKGELYDEALKRGIHLAPLSNAKEVYENRQLQAREFWAQVEHPELGQAIGYCGPFVKLSEAPLRIRRRPPLIGEHNLEVYGELGLSRKELSLLKQARVI